VFAAYREAEHKCRNLMQQYEMKREQNVIECNNAGTFFNFINNKLSCKRGLGALNNDNVDVKLYTVLQTKADYYSLQCKLNQLFEWSEKWQ